MKNRNGSYKKILLSPDSLVKELPYLQQNAQELFHAPLKDFQLCTLTVLLFLRVRHPKNWLQKKSSLSADSASGLLLDYIPATFALNEWEKEKLSGISFEELFLNFNLKGIPLSVNRTMINWIRCNWKIKLLTHIPSPRELLNLQVENSRCITLINNPAELNTLVLSARDPLSFVLHDLMHADQFFNQHESLKGQLGFYGKVQQIYDQEILKQSLKRDKQFRKEFEYVVSDMNAYVIHLFKCFKSAFMKYDPELFSQLLAWWKLDQNEIMAALRLNTPDFSHGDELVLKNFFEQEVRI